jgi:hypothetical protein
MLLLSINFRSSTGRGVSGGSGEARKSRVVAFDSAHQAKFMGLVAKILPPPPEYVFITIKLTLKNKKKI